jgi:hypothetical protein
LWQREHRGPLLNRNSHLRVIDQPGNLGHIHQLVGQTGGHRRGDSVRVCTENSILIDYVTESPNVSGDDRSVMLLPDPVRLAQRRRNFGRPREQIVEEAAAQVENLLFNKPLSDGQNLFQRFNHIWRIHKATAFKSLR